MSLTRKDVGKGFYDLGRCYVVEERNGRFVFVRNPQGDSEARKHHPERYEEWRRKRER